MWSLLGVSHGQFSVVHALWKLSPGLMYKRKELRLGRQRVLFA